MALWPDHKDIEDIFKQGTQRHEFQYDARAWEKMKGLLDRQRRKKFFYWFFGSSTLLALAAVMYFIVDTTKIKTASAIENSDISNKITSPPAVIKDEILRPEKTKDILEDEMNHTSNVRDPLHQTERTIPKTPSPNDIKDFTALSDFKKKTSYPKNNINSESETNLLGELDVESNNQGPSQNRTFSSSSIPNIDFVLLPLIYSVPSISPEMILVEDERESLRWQFSLFGATETSWTPNGEYSDLDYSIGIQIGYLLNYKLSLFLRGDYRSDNYTAMGMDYNAENGFWGNTGMPEYVNASCDMIEVTAGMNYAFNGLNRSGLVVSAGVVSNLMVNEFYNYHFENRDHNFHSSWVNSNSTIIGNIDLGIGYRQMIANRYFLDVTPYAKIPINGVGHGNLMLSSFGVRLQMGFGVGH